MFFFCLTCHVKYHLALFCSWGHRERLYLQWIKIHKYCTNGGVVVWGNIFKCVCIQYKVTLRYVWKPYLWRVYMYLTQYFSLHVARPLNNKVKVNTCKLIIITIKISFVRLYSGFIFNQKTVIFSYQHGLCVCFLCICLCIHGLSSKFVVLWVSIFQKKSQRRAKSNICVDLYMCGIGLWSLSAGPLPGVAAHTVKYEHCEASCGYRHFSNAWIIQSKSIPIDLPGAAIWSQCRKN